MFSLKIHDTVLLSRVSNECEHSSLYVSKDKPVKKIYARSCNRNASNVKVQSSNLNNKAPEGLQRCSGVYLYIRLALFPVFVVVKILFFSREEIYMFRRRLLAQNEQWIR